MERKSKRGGFGGVLRGIGVVTAMVLCCAGPVLLAGGAFAALGGWMRDPLVIIVGTAIVGVTMFSVIRRQRSGQACCLPQRDLSSIASERNAAVDRLPATHDER